jgi:acetoin utilization deacetylase AcuC-like enzyme
VARHAVAEILGAVEAVHDGTVRNAFCAVRPPGHHSHNNTANYDGTCGGEGFCYYSNVAIAARYAQSLGYTNVLICDWDYHHGNGTEWAFYTDPSVFFFSTHNMNAYPGTGDPARTGALDGAGYNLNVHLDMGAADQEAYNAWDIGLAEAMGAVGFTPDFVILSAGFDSRVDDTLGTLALTDAGFAGLTARAMAIADQHCGGRIVSCLEGGYNVDGVGRATCAHVATLAGLDWTKYVPSTHATAARAARTVPARPVVRDGILHLSADAARETGAITVFDASGRLRYRVSPAETGRQAIDVRMGGPGGGFARVQFTDGRTLVVPFIVP